MGAITMNEKQTNFKMNFSPTIRIDRENSEPYYTTKVSATTIANLLKNGIWQYDPQFQRGAIAKNGKEYPLVKKKHYEDIAIAMMEGKMHGGTIELVILKENEEIEYDELTQTTYSTTPGYIADGMHRCMACLMLEKMWNKKKSGLNPNTFEFSLNIHNLDKDGAARLFLEKATKNLPISKTRTEYLASHDKKNIHPYIVLKAINNSVLAGKIEMVRNAIPSNNPSITTFSVIAKAFKSQFKNINDEEKILNMLINGFNKLAKIFPGEFGSCDGATRKALRKKSFIIEANSFYGYMGIFKRALDENDDEFVLKLDKLNDKITISDWHGRIVDRDCPLYKGVVFREDGAIIGSSKTSTTVANIWANYIYGPKQTEEVVENGNQVESA